ncbi:LLM class flavin-dependent oxidoreductase [Frankia sp. QA3]|uniref:LLM class flavin-dependent oxidoreductase n=1 Tax=Frankia sp. QA3 TaxID=710111 RepID=UPI000269C10B|nr:LLM class flavin-dependent oxidoreductase [Frankia sp. QA3]EIV92540.1 flavin-dependent oxidoreductase, F420-dependent methylene-tetrahydromethanopterin reductase [Frankia sp. QA3]
MTAGPADPRAARPRVVFGTSLSTALKATAERLRHAEQADRGGLDLVTLSDHPYHADRIDAYAAVGVLLGRTSRVAAGVSVTNLPTRSAPMLARTLTSLSALSGGRIVLGIGAGGLWDEIVKFGVRRLSPAAAVRALEEAILLIRALSGGGGPVDFDGEFYQVEGLVPAPVPTPPIWTGSLGTKSLAVTGRVADGWIPGLGVVPGHPADWRSARVAWSRPVIDEAAVAAGRRPADIATIYNVTGRITDTPLAVTRDENGRWLGGSVNQWVDELVTAVLDHGAAGFVHHRVDDPTPADLTIGRWTHEVVPKIRAAIERG